MDRYDFGPWSCKTTFNKEDNTRTYEINYRYNNLTFFINSNPKSELNLVLTGGKACGIKYRHASGAGYIVPGSA